MHGLTRKVLAAAIVLAAFFTLVGAAFADDRMSVRVRDDCDPATFNAPPPAGVGPGTCVGDGDTAFADFIAEVKATRAAEDWKFDAENTSIARGAEIRLRNSGGEFHTWTIVPDFGPGLVPILNLLVLGVPLDTPPLAQFLAAPSAANVPLPPGTRTTVQAPATARTYKAQCAIHPWMRMTFVVH